MGNNVKPYPGMIIMEDVVFEPGDYHFDNGLGLIVAADGITIDGNGAVIIGRGKEGKSITYSGIGLFSNGHRDVIVKNLNIKRFRTGMKVMNGSGWTIEDNDLSYNYTDPDFGWGDGDPFGALYLFNITNSLVRANKGNYVWNGLHLKGCEDNRIELNQFSHCTNVCLKLWHSSRNEITGNTMNHGIRIAPGEVHARDSTSVLIESGSNYNRFMSNDFTHGGDGVFIRSLNGWVSTGNYFEDNDASYAHNNAWEVWDPGNTFVNNKGNHSSYGFWLGGSCHAVLIGNEAAYNGLRIANAPEPFGNAGIAVVNGSSSHFVMRHNHIHHNKSAGLAIGYKPGYEAFHWIIEQNVITDNGTYGIYLKHANWINISANVLTGNKLGEMHEDMNVSNVFLNTLDSSDRSGPKAVATKLTERAVAGITVRFEAGESYDPEGSDIVFRWDMGDGTIYSDSAVDHIYKTPGFYRVGLTISNGKLSDLAWLDLYVFPDPSEVLHNMKLDDAQIFQEVADTYTVCKTDPGTAVHEGPSLVIVSDSTLARIRFTIPEAVDLKRAARLTFWMKHQHEEINGFTEGGLMIRLLQDDVSGFVYRCDTPLFNWSSNASEARYGWTLVSIPLLENNSGWKRRIIGTPQFGNFRDLIIEYSSHGGRYRVWLDEFVFL
ncbi:right-handed parallel beta-helix repeat-containing protein [Paenibacillus spongiae]|uniref:Right-handed parallel beta-helix repeat-containing protein n=1 Tax=Paenibacillus spongiae TaxID=2909671 RepID=A0ABY5SH73_9BACL|nr:right-handed parallel beta-helix repeat-containing protein [Paenibacillus spongiae]UVI33351.1 right-handed parallel beta-helix repeat-containing protein [Paenibacillus spongiae]